MPRGQLNIEPGDTAFAQANSTNSKIGVAATTYVAQQSCPSDCVFFDGGGCYAEEGPLGKFITGPLNRSAELAGEDGLTPEAIAESEARAIERMEVHPGRPLRLHTVGDCRTDAAARIVSDAARGYRMRGGGPVWTYTHAWRVVERESWAEVSVLASCETPEDILEAQARGYATAIVVESFPSDRRFTVPVNRDDTGLSKIEGGGATVNLDNLGLSGQPRRQGDRAAHNGGSPVPSSVIQDGEQGLERGAQSVTSGESQRRIATSSGAPLQALNDGESGDSSEASGSDRKESARLVTGGFPDVAVPVSALSIVPCPAQTRDVPCSDCGLCFRDQDRLAAGVTIGFAIHGVAVSVRRAKLALSAPDDPDRKLSSRVLIPRFEAEFQAEHGRLPTGPEVARALGLSQGSVWEMRKSIKLGGPARPARRGKRRRQPR